jgi:hypothetical protein
MPKRSPEKIEEAKVLRIKREPDRALLYIEEGKWEYHIIAKPKEKVSKGDTILYKPYGVNFGWFISVKTKRGRN